jgi:uncharacterized protein (TIGR03382 family)
MKKIFSILLFAFAAMFCTQVMAEQSAGKLSPELLEIVSGRAHPGGPIILRATTARGRGSAPVARLARSLIEDFAPLYSTDDASGRGMVWLRVSENRAAVAALEMASHPDVVWVERYVLPVILNDNSTWLMQSASESQGRTVFRKGLTGFGQVVGVADSGLDADACQFRYGAESGDVTLATGFPQPPGSITDKPENKVITYFVVGSAEPYDDGTGGYHGTHTVGDMAGDNYEHLATIGAAGHDPQDGMAPGAQVVFQDIGANDGTLRGLMGVSMYDLLLQSYRTGARIHNDSYGSASISVAYDSDSASIDEAAWRLNDLVVVFAAGNSGADNSGNIIPSSLGGTGSTAKNTLVAGASGPVEMNLFGTMYYLQDDLVFFSSQGPTADGRIKPDVCAPGLVFSANTDTNSVIDLGCCDYGGQNHKLTSNNEDNNCNVDQDWPTMGTSFSSPLTAGAAALARQYFTDGFWLAGKSSPADGFNPSNALVKAVITNGARPLTGEIVGMGGNSPLGAPPSFAQGWGRVMLEDSLYFEGDERVTLVLDDVPNPLADNPMLAEDAEMHPFPFAGPAVQTASEASWQLPPVEPDGLMKVTLAWSDPPAEPGASATLINNLDLEVVSANNARFIGNKNYDGSGHSQASTADETDMLNNLEQVILLDPAEGPYLVKLHAPSVPGNGEAGSNAQGYALVASGRFLAPQPDSLEPATGVPDTGLSDVKLTGSNFVPGMQVDLGPGIDVGQVEVLDGQTATIKNLIISADAQLGLRDVNAAVYHTLRGTGQGLFEVIDSSKDSSSGCGCGSASSPGGCLTVIFLMFFALRRRRKFTGCDLPK